MSKLKKNVNATLEEEMHYVQNTVYYEGFDYAFVGYSDFKEITDSQFHVLREEYLAARKNLKKYIDDNADSNTQID